MSRETKEIKTPIDGHKVFIKTYITGREYGEIEDILYSGIKISAIADGRGAGANANLDDGSFIKKQTHKTIELLVVSVNGKTNNVLNDVLDMKKDDYLFVVDEIEKVTSDKGTDEVKKKE